jgi:hypothetical protein
MNADKRINPQISPIFADFTKNYFLSALHSASQRAARSVADVPSAD